MSKTKTVSLDSIREERRTNGCYVEGCEEATIGTIEVRVRENRARGGATVVSKSKSACEPHTVSLYNDLLEQIEKRRAK